MGSTHCGYVVEVRELRAHSNADRLQIATFFHEDVCVGLDVNIGDKGIYFPCDLQLDLDFCVKNNLLRELPDGAKGPGYMELSKRNVKAIRLRGEKSNGLYLPISCLAYTGVDVNAFAPGETITVVNGVEICKKYIPIKKSGNYTGRGPATKKAKKNIAPLFAEHADTEQLLYNLGDFKPGDEIEISLKCHGTSQRTAHLPILQKEKYEVDGLLRSAIMKMVGKGKLFHRLGEKWGKPVYEYDIVSGTRRTILDTFDAGFYGSDEFRKQYHDFFAKRLPKDFTVYYEVVGFTHTGQPIMATGKTPKDCIKEYGPTMEFNYGCKADGLPEERSRIFVYRITVTNPDGVVIDLAPHEIDHYCELWGVERVPVFWRGYIPEYPGSKNDDTISAGEWVVNKAEQFYDGKDLFGTHIREGVVVRIVNRPKFTAYKMKNMTFKIVENIIKDVAEEPDMEEADGLDETSNGEV